MLMMHMAAVSSRMEKDIGRIHNCTLNSTVLTEENLHRTEIPFSAALLLKNTFPKSKAHKLLYFRVRLWKSKNLVNPNGK